MSPTLPPELPPADIVTDEKIYLSQLPDGYYVILAEGNKYHVFNSDGVIIGFFNVPHGMSIFDFDVMSNLIRFNEDSELSVDENSESEPGSESGTPPSVDDNPRTGVALGYAVIIPAVLVAVTAKKRKKF